MLSIFYKMIILILYKLLYYTISLPYTFSTLTKLQVIQNHQHSGGSYQPTLCMFVTQPLVYLLASPGHTYSEVQEGLFI